MLYVNSHSTNSPLILLQPTRKKRSILKDFFPIDKLALHALRSGENNRYIN